MLTYWSVRKILRGSTVNKKLYTIKSMYKPLTNSKGDVFEIAMFTRMVADTTSARPDLKKAG
ncbi:MAG: hypothetical protein ABJA70_15900 [Chryseolinea sp.]